MKYDNGLPVGEAVTELKFAEPWWCVERRPDGKMGDPFIAAYWDFRTVKNFHGEEWYVSGRVGDVTLLCRVGSYPGEVSVEEA